MDLGCRVLGVKFGLGVSEGSVRLVSLRRPLEPHPSPPLLVRGGGLGGFATLLAQHLLALEVEGFPEWVIPWRRGYGPSAAGLGA